MTKNTLALILSLIVAGAAFAQEPSTEQPPADTTPAEPSWLSSPEIANRADEISAMLLETQKAIDVDNPDIEALPAQIDALETDVGEMLASATPEQLDELGESDAETLVQKLKRMNRQLSGWRDTLQAHADELDGYARKLREQQEFIDSVLDGNESDDLPDAIVQRVEAVGGSLRQVQDALRKKLDGGLSDLAQISSLTLRINDAVQTIEGKLKLVERDAFSIDRDPIWEVEPADEDFRARVSTELGTRLDSVREFASANRTGIIVTVFLLIFIVIGTLLGRPVVKKRAEESDLDLRERVFIERPVAVAILLWVVLGPQILLPQAPLAIGIVRGLVIAAALWRMLPVIANATERKYIAGLLALFAVESLVEIVPTSDLVLRIVLLALSAAGIYYFTGFRRGLREMPPTQRTLWWRLATVLAAVAPPVLMVCILGIVVGAVGLADQLITTLLVLNIALIAIVVVEDALMATAHFFVTGWGRSWLRSIRRYPDLAKRRVDMLIRLGMLALFVTNLPKISILLQFAGDWLVEFLTTDFTLGNVEISASTILGTIAGVILAIYVARFIRFTLDEDVFPQLPIATGAAAAASRLIYYGLVTGGILFALAASGVEVTRLTLVISALGVGIGFGLQGIVNNFVSGLVLAFERPFQVGDIIEVGLLTGRVREIGLRASRLRTFDGAEVIVPNADLIAGNVINWTLSDRMRRLDVKIGVAYGTDPAKVREILLEIAAGHEIVAKNPEPVALFNEFGESSLDFTLRVWIPEAGDWPQITSDLNEAINAALEEAGIEIPFPQRTLHIRGDERPDTGA
ncbi:MAG: mechanosensitive ion channel domain-containing protein [Gammaproteobacteria bacterium]